MDSNDNPACVHAGLNGVGLLCWAVWLNQGAHLARREYTPGYAWNVNSHGSH
jgi:hypothetical protein